MFRFALAALALLVLQAGPSAADSAALKVAHERQQTLAEQAIKKLRLWTVADFQPGAQIEDLTEALGVLADTVDMIARDSIAPADNFTAGPLFEEGLKADFRRNGWPAPASMSAGFRWIQAQVARTQPQVLVPAAMTGPASARGSARRAAQNHSGNRPNQSRQARRFRARAWNDFAPLAAGRVAASAAAPLVATSPRNGRGPHCPSPSPRSVRNFMSCLEKARLFAGLSSYPPCSTLIFRTARRSAR